MRKRSVLLQGHKTSITMEDAFWDAIKTIADQSHCSVNTVIADIDAQRDPSANLSSCVRVYILEWYRKRVREEFRGKTESGA